MTISIIEPTAPATRPVLRRLAEVLAEHAASGTDATGTAGSDAAGPEPASLHRIDRTAPAMAARVLRAAIEIVCGRRPAEQLAAVLRDDQRTYLVGLRAAAGRLRPYVQSVHSQQPSPGVLEATAVVVLRTGVRALSARFEAQIDTGGARWQCTALHLPLTRGDVATVRRLR
jgi:hypothetical protein